MSDPLLPNSILVAKHWLLAAVPALADIVATTLPDPPWPGDQFVQVMNVGGAPEIDNPMFHPVVSVNIYAMKPGSARPPWGKAATLGMKIVTACYNKPYAPADRVRVALPGDFDDAIVTSVYPVSDLREVPSDPSQYAVYSLDLNLTWVPASLVVSS